MTLQDHAVTRDTAPLPARKEAETGNLERVGCPHRHTPRHTHVRRPKLKRRESLGGRGWPWLQRASQQFSRAAPARHIPTSYALEVPACFVSKHRESSFGQTVFIEVDEMFIGHPNY
jgi:hypothetical protein